jgi:hypothetical protein
MKQKFPPSLGYFLQGYKEYQSPTIDNFAENADNIKYGKTGVIIYLSKPHELDILDIFICSSCEKKVESEQEHICDISNDFKFVPQGGILSVYPYEKRFGVFINPSLFLEGKLISESVDKIRINNPILGILTQNRDILYLIDIKDNSKRKEKNERFLSKLSYDFI